MMPRHHSAKNEATTTATVTNGERDRALHRALALLVSAVPLALATALVNDVAEMSVEVLLASVRVDVELTAAVVLVMMGRLWNARMMLLACSAMPYVETIKWAENEIGGTLASATRTLERP